MMYIMLGTYYSIFSLIGWWGIFRKAGYSGWYAVIPIVNLYFICKIITGNGLNCLLFLIPIVNIFYAFYLLFRLSFVFGHGILFGFGLLFFYGLFILILGFGKSRYFYRW